MVLQKVTRLCVSHGSTKCLSLEHGHWNTILLNSWKKGPRPLVTAYGRQPHVITKADFWAAIASEDKALPRPWNFCTTGNFWNGHLHVRQPTPEGVWHLKMQVWLETSCKRKMKTLPLAMTSATHTPSKPGQWNAELYFTGINWKHYAGVFSPLNPHRRK